MASRIGTSYSSCPIFGIGLLEPSWRAYAVANKRYSGQLAAKTTAVAKGNMIRNVMAKLDGSRSTYP
jgi:hypothetical protein